MRARSDRALAEAARGQHGVLLLAQLEALGLSARAVRDRRAAGRLVRIHQGVYALDPPTQKGRWLAAVLACGAGAVLSHRSAAALWGLGSERRAIDVSVPSRAGRARAGVAVHRGGGLHERERTIVDGIPCTTVARTLLDLAAVVDKRALERAIDRAEQLRLFDLAGVTAVVERNARRRGAARLAAALDDHAPPALTRSAAEERFLALVRAAGLPAPRVNAWIPLPDGSGYEADFLWPDRRLIVEVDGREHHATRWAFSHDRRRDRRLALAGYETRRFAASELAREPARVVAEVRALLALAAEGRALSREARR